MYTLLFVVGGLYPNIDATSGIAYRIADNLKTEHDCRIIFVGFKRFASKDSNLSLPERFETFTIDSIGELDRLYSIRHSRIRRFFSTLKKRSTRRLYFNRLILGVHKAWIIEYQKAIKSVLKKYKIDCSIGFAMPYETLIALSMIDTSIPFVACRMDPWGLNYFNKNNPEAKIEDELIDKKCSSIITTRLIYDEYLKSSHSSIVDKVKVIEFPNLVHQIVDDQFSDYYQQGYINCVYTGGLREDIRDPDYTFRLFGLLKDKGILLHIFGSCDGAIIERGLPDNVIYHGKVDNETSIGIMNQADILVNIGNSVENQMPSKLITYISTGKPILNIVKSGSCATLAYTDKYPYALSIQEEKKISDNVIMSVFQFLADNKDKKIDFLSVQRLFKECTPEYVGNIVFRAIEKTSEGK